MRVPNVASVIFKNRTEVYDERKETPYFNVINGSMKESRGKFFFSVPSSPRHPLEPFSLMIPRLLKSKINSLG